MDRGKMGEKRRGKIDGKKRGSWIVRNLIAGALLVVSLLIITIATLKIITRHNRELEVPNFSGISLAEAKQIAKQKSLRVDVTDSVFIPRMARGEVFRQNPIAGSRVKKNRRVLLTINSLQPKMVAMPSITGYSLRQAKAELAAKQLKVGTLIYVSDIATNNVLGQLYKGRELTPGSPIEIESEIDLRVGMSSESNKTTIPSLIGYSLATAKDILIDNSLNIGQLHFDNSVKNYGDTLSSFVVKQLPPPSEDQNTILGSRVTLYLSVDRDKLESAQ